MDLIEHWLQPMNPSSKFRYYLCLSGVSVVSQVQCLFSLQPLSRPPWQL